MGKVAGGMAAAGGALQAGKMAHNAIKPKEVSEYDDYDCDEGLGRSVLKTVAKTKKFVKSASPNAKEFAANTLQGGALIGGGAAIGGHLSRKANESDYDCDESIGSSAAVAGAGLIGGGALARLGGRSAEKKIKRPKSVSEYDDYDCDEGVIGKTVKYGLAAGAALGAGKMAHNAIKKPKNSDESLAAAMNGGRIPRRAKSVSVQESEEFDPYKQLMLDAIEDSEEIAFGRTFDDLIEKMQKFFEPSEIYNICLKSKLNEKDFDKPHFCRNPKSRPTIFKIDMEPEEMEISTIEFILKKGVMN